MLGDCRGFNLKLMKSCPHYSTVSTLLLQFSCCPWVADLPVTAGHGPVQMPEKFLDCFGVPCIVSVSHLTPISLA